MSIQSYSIHCYDVFPSSRRVSCCLAGEWVSCAKRVLHVLPCIGVYNATGNFRVVPAKLPSLWCPKHFLHNCHYSPPPMNARTIRPSLMVTGYLMSVGNPGRRLPSNGGGAAVTPTSFSAGRNPWILSVAYAQTS